MSPDEKRDAQKAAVKALDRFSYNSTTPFGGSAEDIAYGCLSDAYSITILLSNVLDETGTDLIRPVHAAGVVHGIGKLIALAQFALEGAE
jgi:hypothetical protein